MRSLYESAIAGNLSFNPTSITFADEAPPASKRTRPVVTRTGFVILKCKACGEAWRVEAAADLWEIRYAHVRDCLDLLDMVAERITRFGIEDWRRNRVQFIGLKFSADAILHKAREGRELTTCDHRCQNAKGSDCDCKCGGAAHGVAHAKVTSDK